MVKLRDWEKYADDDNEQPSSRVKIKPSSAKIKITHVEDPEWKLDREGKRRRKLDAKSAALSVKKTEERDSKQFHRTNGINEVLSHDKRRQSARVGEKISYG